MRKPSSFKRLNKITKFRFGYVVFTPMLFLTACKHKDRLASSTFTFGITPPAASVVKTDSLTLTAHGNSAGGTVAVNPTWSVVYSTLGTLNTSLGTSVTFQPTALGDALITATFDGIQANSQIAIVTYKPTANTFKVYNDDGLPTGSDVNSDIFTIGGLSIAELSSGYTPEGVKYQRTTNAVTNDFWGVTLDKANTGKRKDLSAFNSGSLKFAFRLVGRTLGGGETIRIDVTDSAATTSFTLVSGSDGYNRLDTGWQEISLSFTHFPGVDFAHIKVPFAIVTTSLTQPLTFDVDAVRWER